MKTASTLPTALWAHHQAYPLGAPPFRVEALDGGESGGIECGIALRVACGGAWVMIAVAVSCSDGYQCLLCRQVYQGLAGKSRVAGL